MNFDSLKSSIFQLSTDKNFDEATRLLEKMIFGISRAEFIPIIIEIGSIPECIQIDSSAEKLYSKASEIVLARCFQELGLASQVIKTRSNCADVIAKSRHHDYSLVADAKSFRLSRTAKNQKDFKVESMVSWKGDNDFAVLACPYFQYPRKASQIYTQALDGNVLLFSWEHLSFLIKNKIVENDCRNLASIWNMSHVLASKYTRADKKIVFLNQQDELLCKDICTDINKLVLSLSQSRDLIVKRGNMEIDFFNESIEEIKHYSHEKAIAELIRYSKLNEKSDAVSSYMDYLVRWEYGC